MYEFIFIESLLLFNIINSVNFFTGKQRASYVKSLSGKNVLYREDTLIEELQGAERTKCLNAMRARRARMKKKAEKSKQR